MNVGTQKQTLYINLALVFIMSELNFLSSSKLVANYKLNFFKATFSSSYMRFRLSK